MIYDVTIVGAGPGGSYLGYLLAKRGLRVAILDQKTFPREKVCGGGLSQKTVELVEFDISPIVQRRMIGAYLTYENRDAVIKDLGDRAGVAVVRFEFDDFLLERARAHGASFFPRCSFENARSIDGLVEASTSRRPFQSKFLIGADGVFSKVRSSCFGKGLVEYAPVLETLIPAPKDRLDRFGDRVVFDFGGMPRGYGWIFPKRDHFNVGVFSPFGARNLRADLRRFIRHYPFLRDHAEGRHMGFAIPLKNTRRQFQKENVWLVGDAAGFAESFYGEGIYFALKSAVLAARALTEDFDLPSSSKYSQLVGAELWEDLHYSALNARMFFLMQKLGFYWMVRNRHVNSYFAELIAGGVGHKECFYKTLLTSPYWLFSKHLPPAGPEVFEQ